MFNVGHDPKFKKSNKVFLLVFFICYTVFLTTGLPTKDIYKWQCINYVQSSLKFHSFLEILSAEHLNYTVYFISNPLPPL